MKSNSQDQANGPVLWDVLKHKFEKSSTSNTSGKDDEFYSQRHDDHQEDDAPPEGEKRVKRQKTSNSSKFDAWEEETIIDEDEVIPEDETPKLITEFQNVDKRVPTIFDHARMDATLNDMLSNQFRNAEEYAYHLEQAKNFMENQINRNTEEKKYILSLHKIHVERFPKADLEEKMNLYKQNQRRVRDNPEDYFSNHRITEVIRITTDQPHGLDFMEQIIMMRENDKSDSFSEADFKYMNKNDIEDLYYLCWNKKLGIESYQIKVNLTTPILTFPGIEAHEPYLIVDKPTTGLIYLNRKDKKRVMYLVEIVKFCYATLEKVLKEVKLKIFQSEPWKKPPLLGELDRDIIRAFKIQITKRLRHQEHMRRWESFVNGRPILPTMKRL
ncbi:hypothetical protein Tco_0723637 [Tanacetum coccineum]